jgi:hypothetical protein
VVLLTYSLLLQGALDAGSNGSQGLALIGAAHLQAHSSTAMNVCHLPHLDLRGRSVAYTHEYTHEVQATNASGTWRRSAAYALGCQPQSGQKVYSSVVSSAGTCYNSAGKQLLGSDAVSPPDALCICCSRYGCWPQASSRQQQQQQHCHLRTAVSQVRLTSGPAQSPAQQRQSQIRRGYHLQARTQHICSCCLTLCGSKFRLRRHAVAAEAHELHVWDSVLLSLYVSAAAMLNCNYTILAWRQSPPTFHARWQLQATSVHSITHLHAVRLY